LIEPGLARLAAERATSEDIALLHQSVRDFEASGKDNLKLVSSDLLFHRAIFQASKNGPAASVFHCIHRAMAKMILVTSQLVDVEHTLAFHKPIMQAIERRDGEKAAKLMAEHLADATELLTKEQEHQHQQLLYKRITGVPRPVALKKPHLTKKPARVASI
jgi:GntR family transcriptional repressor for pyruvate dehydrogenase complex